MTKLVQQHREDCRCKACRNARAPKEREPRFVPKAGPGQVFVEEGTAISKFRNIGEHPLTLAFERGKLLGPGDDVDKATARFESGDRFRTAFERMGRSGRDSTELVGVAGGRSGAPWSQSQRDAMRFLQRCREDMAPNNFAIVWKFCGEGWAMPDACRAAKVVVHPDGVAYRVREALDDLVQVRP